MFRYLVLSFSSHLGPKKLLVWRSYRLNFFWKLPFVQYRNNNNNNNKYNNNNDNNMQISPWWKTTRRVAFVFRENCKQVKERFHYKWNFLFTLLLLLLLLKRMKISEITDGEIQVPKYECLKWNRKGFDGWCCPYNFLESVKQ